MGFSKEIDMRKDNPRLKTQEILDNAGLLATSPSAGTSPEAKNSSGAIKREDIIGYEAKNYLSENMTIAAAGNFGKEMFSRK